MVWVDKRKHQYKKDNKIHNNKYLKKHFINHKIKINIAIINITINNDKILETLQNWLKKDLWNKKLNHHQYQQNQHKWTKRILQNMKST